MDTVRGLRVLEYVGPRDWVEKTLTQGSVPMNGEYILRDTYSGQPARYIRSAVIGSFAEIYKPEPTDPEKHPCPADGHTPEELSNGT